MAAVASPLAHTTRSISSEDPAMTVWHNQLTCVIAMERASVVHPLSGERGSR